MLDCIADKILSKHKTLKEFREAYQGNRLEMTYIATDCTKANIPNSFGR